MILFYSKFKKSTKKKKNVFSVSILRQNIILFYISRQSKIDIHVFIKLIYKAV